MPLRVCRDRRPISLAHSLLIRTTDESQVWTLVVVGERLVVGAGD
jgi:hypothetical protein